MQKRILSLLVLLVTAVTGAWAVSAVASIGETNYATLQAAFTAAESGQTIKLLSDVTQVGGVGKDDGTAVTFDLNGHIYTCTEDYGVVATDNSQITIIDSSTGTPGGIKSESALVSQDNGKIIIKGGRYNIGDVSAEQLLEYFPLWGVEMYSGYTLQDITPADAQGFCVGVVAPTPVGYGVALKSSTEDASNWQGKAGTGDYQSMPLEGVAAGTAVNVKYSGTKMVKSVKAVKKAASGPEVTTFSELQTALSAGKDVKLMNDIVCTEEINITSGALTIDGNGKKLSTTSEIRAFKVGSSATVAFKDLTLTGFVSGGGPAINNSGTIVLDGCTISNCHVNNSNGGGAIENKSSNGKLYAINTTFSGNYSGEIGGAINNYGGSLYMSGCTFANNYTTKSNAYWGGAIGINSGSEVRLINCSFSGNQYGTNAGPSDIGVYSNPTNYTIAGCTGATIASDDGDITPNTTGTATLDYSDLSNISFTYTPVTVTWNSPNFNGNTYTQDGVTLTPSNDESTLDHNFYDYGANTFTTTLGKFTKIEIVCTSGDIDGWTKETAGKYQPYPDIEPDNWQDLYKLTWTGDAESVTIQEDVYGIQSITFNIQ